MKKFITLVLFTAVLFYANQSNAKIRRIGYFGTPVAKTDFPDLQSAQDSSSTGDTLLLFPGTYYGATLYKKLVVLGYGYFVAGSGSNANLQNITGSLSISITLDSTAAGTLLEGIDGLTVYAAYSENVKNITIRRCNCNINFNGQTLDNWQILQSYVNYISYQYYGGVLTNFRVDNCFIGGMALTSSGTGTTGQFTNDIVVSYNGQEFSGGTFLIKNCIFAYYHGGDGNCVYQNSIANSYYPLPSGSGNQNISSDSLSNDVFVGFYTQGTFSNDGRWALATGSPAKGAGAGGTDCGIFGGNNPYKLSGIPSIPAFYKLSATSTTTSSNPYTITFSVRSNN